MPPLRLVVRPNGLTIEDVFVSASAAAASARGGSGGDSGGGSGGAAAPASPTAASATASTPAHAASAAPSRGAALERIVLTPRSAEACLMEGVDPKDLFDRPLESFADAHTHLDPAIVRMRFETYSRLRHEKMEAVRSARQRISDEAQRHGGLDALMPGMLSTTGGLDSSARSPGRASAASHGAGGRRTSHSGGGGTGAGGGSVISATPLEQVRVLEEARKLERIQERQKRELERLMDEEMRLSALRSQSERTSQMRSGAEGASEVGLAAKRRAEAEERRLREQKRRLAEEQAEEQKRHMVQQAKNKEAALMQEAQRKAAEKAREVAERDLIRQQKAAEHRRDAEAKTREREKQILERMAVLQHAEAVRTAKAERESAERERDAEQRRAAAEERIRLSQEQTATVERLRVEALHDKEAKAEQRRLERERRAEADKASKAQESFLETQKRALLLAEARREEETRKAIMEARTAAEAETLRRMHDDADRELALKRERSRLEDLAKADAIERTRLKEQYRRSHLMRVVEERESHTAEVRNQRAETQHLRREIAAKANLQREMVMHAMEAARLKKNWKEARAELEGIMAAGTQQLLKSAGLEPDALKQFNAAAAARHKSSGGAGASSSGAGAVASAGSSGDEDSGHLEAQLQHEQFMQQQAQMQAQLQAQMQAHMQQHLQMPVHGQFVSGSAGGGGYMDAAQRAFDDAVAEAAAAGGGSGTGSAPNSRSGANATSLTGGGTGGEGAMTRMLREARQYQGGGASDGTYAQQAQQMQMQATLMGGRPYTPGESGMGLGMGAGLSAPPPPGGVMAYYASANAASMFAQQQQQQQQFMQQQIAIMQQLQQSQLAAEQFQGPPLGPYPGQGGGGTSRGGSKGGRGATPGGGKGGGTPARPSPYEQPLDMLLSQVGKAKRAAAVSRGAPTPMSGQAMGGEAQQLQLQQQPLLGASGLFQGQGLMQPQQVPMFGQLPGYTPMTGAGGVGFMPRASGVGVGVGGAAGLPSGLMLGGVSRPGSASMPSGGTYQLPLTFQALGSAGSGAPGAPAPSSSVLHSYTLSRPGGAAQDVADTARK